MTETKPVKTAALSRGEDAGRSAVAVLIDAENVLPAFADAIFSNAEALGEVVAREIFGVAAALTTWVDPVLRYAIHPNLTIRASKGKNTSDIALVIGAMDLLIKGNVDTVVIASSDSDFSTLSVRLRTAGIHVVGMGMEKSNPLWRTASSSFVVLEHPASPNQGQRTAQEQRSAQDSRASRFRSRRQSQPAEPPAQEQKPQQESQSVQEPQPVQEQKAQQGKASDTKEKAASTHRDRVAAIQQIILKRLASGGGRVQASTLFSALNRLPEYRTDRLGSGKKPLNYLTSTFADIFDFEDSADGKVWVTMKVPAAGEAVDAVEVTDAAEEAAAPASVEEPVPLEEAVEAEPEQAAEADSGEVPGAEAAPEVEVAYEEEAAPRAESAPEQDEAVVAFVARLVEDGMDRETAENIAGILAESDNLRTAYNTLRKVYGNAGRDYYHRAKQILTGK